MAQWVWSYRVLKILPLIASSPGDVPEADCDCGWQWIRFILTRLLTPSTDLYIRGKQKILSPNQTPCNSFNLAVSLFLIPALVPEKPA
jgi:hypothetical protein